MSLLTIVQQAMSEIGLGSPQSVVGNSDVRVSQAQGLVNRAGSELLSAAKAADYWPVVRKQYLFNLLGLGPFSGTFVAGTNVITGVSLTNLSGVQVGWQCSSQYALNDTMVTAVDPIGGNVTLSLPASGSGTDTNLAFGQEAYPYPSDLGHFIPQSAWDRNFRWQLLGPVDAQEWQVLKSGISPVGPRIRYRLMQGMIYINPAPYVPTGQNSAISNLICFEYASKFWCAPAGTTGQPTQSMMVADGDISLAFPEDLLTLSLKWRMLKAIGNAYGDEREEYDDKLDRTTGRQTMPRNLPMNAQSQGIRLLNSQNVPDTGFGS